MILLFLLVIVLVVALSPAAPYARTWGYYPSGGLIGLVLIVLLVLWLTGNLGHVVRL